MYVSFNYYEFPERADHFFDASEAIALLYKIPTSLWF